MSMLVNSRYTFFCLLLFFLLIVFICVITFFILQFCNMILNNLIYSYRELRELKDILERLEDKHNDIINVVRETNEINRRILNVNKCILNVMGEIKYEKTRNREFL